MRTLISLLLLGGVAVGQGKLGDFDGWPGQAHIALFDFILRGSGNDCMARIITDTTYRYRMDYRALAKEMLARYRRECQDPLVSAWDAYAKECEADSFQRQDGWYVSFPGPPLEPGKTYTYWAYQHGDTLSRRGHTVDGRHFETWRWKSTWFKGAKPHYSGPYIRRTPTFPGFIEYLRKRK